MDVSDTEFDQGYARWMLANLLKFWSECPVKRCRRARSCCGDANVCNAIFWPVVPEDFKVWLGALAEAKRDGSSVRQAGRHAQATVAGWRQRQAQQATVAKVSQ